MHAVDVKAVMSVSSDRKIREQYLAPWCDVNDPCRDVDRGTELVVSINEDVDRKKYNISEIDLSELNFPSLRSELFNVHLISF